MTDNSEPKARNRYNAAIDVFTRVDIRGPNECWPWKGGWGGRKERQRPYFYFGGNRIVAYRVVLALKLGEAIPDDKYVLHTCDNGAHPIGCCNPAHMRIGTNAENVIDRTTRHRQGLPPVIVRNIRRLIAKGVLQRVIAANYGISRETVSAISTERVHTLPEDYPADDVLEFEGDEKLVLMANSD